MNAGEPCPECGHPLDVLTAIEVGHIFKLGTEYAEAMGATVLDRDGKAVVLWMGSYGIGVERNLAAVVEANHDDQGISWPVAVAPWEVVLTVLRQKDDAVSAAAGRLHDSLVEGGIDVIIDDRDERPGVKFNDAELVGIPYRVTIGPRGIEAGTFEVVERASGQTTEVAIGDVAEHLTSLIVAARAGLAD